MATPDRRAETKFVPPPPHIRKYQIGSKIGAGAFAEVYVAIADDTKQKHAIKVFPKSNLHTQSDIDRFQREVDAMAYLHYDSLVSMTDFFWDDNNFYLVMDYCEGGELFSYIVEQGRVSEPVAALLFKQIAGALAYCHSFGVAHRDLKPENILIAHFPVIKVTDFGLCGYVNQERLMQSFCGSPCYCAPECLCRVQYDGRLSDMWSLGVILYAMVTGEHPWSVLNTSLMLRQIMKANYTIPPYVSPDCADLIRRLLVVKPLERIPMEKLLQHPWLKYSEWALIPSPPNLDHALNTMRLQQPITLEQISSSSSRSSHQSDHGIVSPFDNSYQNEMLEQEDDLISLASMRNASDPNVLGLAQFRTSMEDLLQSQKVKRSVQQEDGGRRVILRSASSSRFRKGLLCIPKVNKCVMMQPIKEEGA